MWWRRKRRRVSITITPQKTIAEIERHIPDDLPRAYEQTLRLRSQLLSLIYDAQDFSAPAGQEGTLAGRRSEGQNHGGIVTLILREPLPSQKELTEAVEEHWKAMIEAAISAAARQERLPWFDKAFVEIEITVPRGTHTSRAWDTSNRAIQVILNNLKGVFFRDDDAEHLAFSVVGGWGEGIGETVIRVWSYDKWEQIKARLLGSYED